VFRAGESEIEGLAPDSLRITDRHRAAIVINCHVDHFGFGDSSAFLGLFDSICFYEHFDGNRSSSDAYQFGIKADNIANEHWSDKHDLVHGFGDDLLGGMLPRFDGCGDIDIAQNDSSEDRAVSICILGHQNDSNSGIGERLAHIEDSVDLAFRLCQRWVEAVSRLGLLIGTR